MSERSTHPSEEQTEFSEERVHVNATVLVGRPATIVPVPEGEPEEFTHAESEDTLGKVGRPTSRGRYAHVPYGSEDLIRDKRAEVEVEDLSS